MHGISSNSTAVAAKKKTVPSLFFNEKISNDKLSEAEGEKQSELDALCSHMFLFLIILKNPFSL